MKYVVKTFFLTEDQCKLLEKEGKKGVSHIHPHYELDDGTIKYCQQSCHSDRALVPEWK